MTAQASKADAIEIAPDEAPSALLFLSLGTQWRWGPDRPVGLDYSAIAPTAELIGVKLGVAEFSDLKTMEAEALKVFASRRKK